MTEYVPPRPWIQHYAPGVPAEVEEPTGSLADLLDETVARHGDRHAALEFFGRETTYATLREQIDRAAEGLRQLGVRAGDPVALILPNCPQHIAAFYAILRLGAIVVEHNPLYTPRELRHQFEDHGAKFAIAWNKVVGTIQDFPEDLEPKIVSVDITRAMPPIMRGMLRLPIRKARESRAALTEKVRGTVTWEQLLEHPGILDDVPKPGLDDVALLQYTSGTTGTPKAATLSHRNLVVNAAQARAWVPDVQRGPDCVVYAVLPMFHAYGLTLCLTFAMSMGGRLVLFPRFDPDLVLKVAKKRPPTFLPAVPPIYQRLRLAAEEQGVSLRGAQVSISGAMPLPTSIVEPWEAATGGTLVEGYGLSECSPVLVCNPVGPGRRIGTIGLPVPSTEVRVVNPDDPSQDMPQGEQGELIVRGPQVMSGYWQKPEETAAVFVPATDGGRPWFRTGDIVRLEGDGHLVVVDRIKELVITGGFNVMPSEVEEVLRRHPSIEDAAVVGLPDGASGEQVVAAVVLAPGAKLDVDAVREFARGQIAAYKVPRRLFVIDELPKSLIGKVLRKQVKEQLVGQ
ncbi:MAG: AMP-binding protein [Microbacteriaceae bacterium]|nr:AMP-binding protein [Microbacteriaceae bacterium]